MSVQPTYSGRRTGVRVVVVGDRGTGKSSLIVSLATETFPESLPPVLPPTTLPADLYPDRVPVTIIDTSSSLDSGVKRSEELKRADVVMLTYACDQPITLDRISGYWLPELRRLEVNVPVILVGCKMDLRDEHDPISMEQAMTPIMQAYRQIETCIECSAANFLQVPEAFYYAQKAVLHPTLPLFDQETQSLQPRCVSALRRIFTLCDQDMDGALNDEELNAFQVKCFGSALQPNEIIGVQRVVQEKLPEGVNENGLTLDGFLFLHALFIEKGRLETTWAVMRKFGYEDDLQLREDFVTIPFKVAPDQSVELTTEAVEFLRGIFRLHDTDNDGALRPNELDMLFATAPESPWSEPPYQGAAERTALGDLTLNGFLSEWALMTLTDPEKSMANLIYTGYRGSPASALHLTRRRKVDRKKQKTERNVFNCFVFGPKKAGKSAIINSFIERPFSKIDATTTGERWAVNAVDEVGGNKKTLILREIPEDEVKFLLSKKNSLAACDVAVFVYDSSDEHSWKRSKELLAEVASKGDESEDYLVPCLLIAAKDDLDPYPMAVRDSLGVSQELGIEAPIRVSMKQSNLNNVFGRIVYAAEHPHLSIPETETRKNRRKYRQLFNRSLTFVSVGAAAAVVGLAVYRNYAARKSSST
ncbi:PREDICTED: mitochondrial Rho GTPase 2 [Fragaria vesca subsp. vesca]|uniref:mitochondrial Rho GTPase 2 n=1 Tax=Fragaria vesca subsp. vesca TaxID=101020 RepID=UPI0002C34895|nr:PREDICTED: mitochondrial Rho GTPase 2 [Fragaria vesca subsp. vesca]